MNEGAGPPRPAPSGHQTVHVPAKPATRKCLAGVDSLRDSHGRLPPTFIHDVRRIEPHRAAPFDDQLRLAG
jgi:hypothetical protein